MRLKRLWQFLFVAKDLGRRVEILFAAIVATRMKASINRRARRDGVRYSERNPVSGEQILSKMIEVILAKHDPAVLRIFPHGSVFLESSG